MRFGRGVQGRADRSTVHLITRPILAPRSRSASAISPTLARARTASMISGMSGAFAAAGDDPARAASRSAPRAAVTRAASRAPRDCEPQHLVPLERRVIGRGNDRRRRVVGELVHADDHRLAALDAHLMLVRAARDLLLEERRLDRLRRAAELVDLRRAARARGVRARSSDARRSSCRRADRPSPRRRTRTRRSAACGARASPPPPSAARAPRRSRSCAATACRRAPRRAPAP